MTKEAKKFLAWKEKQESPEKQKNSEIDELKKQVEICTKTIKTLNQKARILEGKIDFLVSENSVLSVQKSINCDTVKKMINKLRIL
jgi:hypothetical protein